MPKGARLVNRLPESLIVKIWQQQLLDRTDLLTEEGEPIRIIYPGRINDDRGADLLDAIIATSQGLVKGDIEVHDKSSNWRNHRHHLDPNYNRVVLHVVFWRDTEATTELQNGEKVPILALHKYTKTRTLTQNKSVRSPVNLSMRCHKATERLNRVFMGEFLDSAGEERFLAKATRFQANLAQTEASQSLYQGIMAALGYAKNKLPFHELAQRLPLSILMSLIQGKISDEECLIRQQALLLGTAGLLPSQRLNWHQTNQNGEEWINKLEKVWASSPQTETMSENDWHFFKVRPINFPTRRIAAMSHLILRYTEKRTFEEVINNVMETMVGAGYRALEKALMVTTDGYWASHFDFGLASRLKLPSLLGGRRAAGIVVNVLLPFAFAWGTFNSQPELPRRALELYRLYPKLLPNTLERHMIRQFELSSSLVNSAQRQQGLIHIYRTLCSQGRCDSCPL